MEPEEQQYQNWTVDSGQHNLVISALQPGKRYWVTIAAVNGAGVGMLSDPHGFVISEQNFAINICIISVFTKKYSYLNTLKKRSCRF